MAKPVRHGKKWRIRWIDETGTRQSAVFTERRDAMFALREREAQAEKIRRGLIAPPPQDRLFSELCDYYLQFHSSQKRRQRDDESIIRAHLRPSFGSLLLREVADQVDAFKVSRKHLERKTLHNILTLLIAMLRVAHERKWLLELPRIKKPQVRLFEQDFHYLRTREEIHRYLVAARAEGELFYALAATAVYTGMRPGELAGLQWADVNWEGRLIVVQRSYESCTKSRDVRYVPILDPLLPILRAWRLRFGGPLVFTNRNDKMFDDSSRIFQEVHQRVLTRAGFQKVMKKGRLLPYIRFYDLRHTFASHWVMNDGNLRKLTAILGHKDPKMTMRYAHLAPHAYNEDFARLGDSVPSEGAVIALRVESSVSCK